MTPGQRVRLKSAPDRIGVLTTSKTIRGRVRWKVQLPDSLQSIPEQNLELVEEKDSIESLITKGHYGKVINLRGAITHSRLTGRLADIIYSMEATNTEFFSYQFKPVLNFLESPCDGILIADEVGLGKTIEAGLIWTELKARVDANRLLVICPAVLREKWAEELLHRFGIRADICDSRELLERLKRNANSPDEDFAIIASMQGLRPPKHWDEDEEIKSNTAELARFINHHSAERELFDCVIIDEAHYMRNPESQTHQLGQLIRPATANIILLSATPIQLRSDDLFHLLNIIDNENFEYKQTFDQVLNANRPIIALACALRGNRCEPEDINSAVEECLQNPLLQNNRQLSNLKANPPTLQQLADVNFRIGLANRIERINLLGSAITRTRKRDVQGKKVIRVPEAQSITMSAIEHEFYQEVTESVRNYCENYGLFEGFMLTIPQRQLCSSIPAAFRFWQKKTASFDDEIIHETVGSDIEEKLSQTSAAPLVQHLASQSKQLSTFEALKENDSKYKSLINLLVRYWKDNPGQKVVLFSYFRETLQYIKERLSEDGIDAALLMGGMNKEKGEIIAQFRSEKGPNIILASEVLSEGVDLQFSSALINYDLPWNPMKVEQRIGRIDRIGQEKERILIWNFFYEDSLDDRVYSRLFERLKIFEHALGDLEAVLGEKIRRLSYELLSHKLTKTQEIEQIDQTASAIANEKQLQEKLEEEAAGLTAHGDYVLNRVEAAKEMRRFIDGSHLWVYIRDHLKQHYQGSKLVIKSNTPLSVDIELSLKAKSDLQAYLEKHPSLGRTNLFRAAMGDPVNCCFDNKVDFGNKKYEVINQSHSLVRFVASQTCAEEFHSVVASELNSSQLPSVESGRYMILCKQWSTTGAKTVERLIYRGVCLDTGRTISDDDAEHIVNAAVDSGREWLAANSELQSDNAVDYYHDLEVQLDDQFSEYCEKMQLENEDRVDFLINTLTGKVERDINSRLQAIEKLKAKNNYKMIKLNEGRIRKLKENRDRKIIQLKEQKKINTEPRDVILGVFCIK